MPMLGAIAAIGLLGGSLMLTPVNGVSTINWARIVSTLGVGGTVAYY
ncbi:hypothetical protein [Vulcanisaeta sp. JCM 14467]|nr:hypothetical protein [Vulcanisaeta sp. JCM 14467]